MAKRKPYPTDVCDEEWALVAPYLILFPLDAGQRRLDLREVIKALRYVVRTGCPWRMQPNDLPPRSRVHQQVQRWFKAGCCEPIEHNLRMQLRLADGRTRHPSAAILDSRTLQSTPTSGARAGYDGAKRKKGSKAHLAVDTPGNLLALHVTPARTPPSRHWSMASPSRWSSFPRPSGASCCRPALGGRARFRLGRPLSPPGSRIRTPARKPGRRALSGLCLPHALKSNTATSNTPGRRLS